MSSSESSYTSSESEDDAPASPPAPTPGKPVTLVIPPKKPASAPPAPAAPAPAVPRTGIPTGTHARKPQSEEQRLAASAARAEKALAISKARLEALRAAAPPAAPAVSDQAGAPADADDGGHGDAAAPPLAKKPKSHKAPKERSSSKRNGGSHAAVMQAAYHQGAIAAKMDAVMAELAELKRARARDRPYKPGRGDDAEPPAEWIAKAAQRAKAGVEAGAAAEGTLRVAPPPPKSKAQLEDEEALMRLQARVANFL